MARTKSDTRSGAAMKTPRTTKRSIAGKAPRQALATYTSAARKSAALDGNRKKTGTRPGVKALKEIRKLQKSTDLLLRKRPFLRLVKYITNTSYPAKDIRYMKTAIEALQCAAESYLTEMFEDGNLCAMHAKRVTIMPRDLFLLHRIRSRFDNLSRNMYT